LGSLRNSQASFVHTAGKLKEKFTNSRPEYDIIICAFNGEESGLQGSKAFVQEAEKHYPLINDINIECIEGKESQELILIGDPDLGQKSLMDMRYHSKKPEYIRQ
jgi:aminopeptidase YwaD